jgi:hypothetical protein
MGLVLLTGTCSECGCTAEQPCEDDFGLPCHWTDATRTLCSACADDAVDAFDVFDDDPEVKGYF